MRLLLITSASILTLAAFHSTAWAQDCTSDADCPDGYACEPVGDLGGVPACDGPDCTDQTACIRREGPCTTDADCPADSVCEEVGGAGGCPVGTCPPGEQCPEPAPCVIEVLTECVPAPLTCDTDTDCPSPLLCVERQNDVSCTVAFGETTPCKPNTEVTKQCGFVPADCSSNAHCAAGYECVTMPGGESCSSSGMACQVGQECPPPEVVCETEPDIQMCFPARAPCAADADCSGDWSCIDFVAAVGEPPPWWGPVDDPRACMPPGIVAVLEGRAEFEEGGSSSSAASERAGSGSAAQSPSGSPSGGSGDDGGCSVASGSTEGKGIAGLLLLGLALGLRRRRTRGSR